jgi:hypothetical protein
VTMMDVILIGTAVLFFVVCAVAVFLCERL